VRRYSREELIGQDHRIINSGNHPKEFIGCGQLLPAEKFEGRNKK
jgi:hypothetical protein